MYTLAFLLRVENLQDSIVFNIIEIKKPMEFIDDLSYVATKNALLMFTKKLAIELIKDNVRVNNVVIAYIPNSESQNEQAFPYSDRNWQDLVATIIYLASKNSGSITGQDIFITNNKMQTSLV